MDLPFDEYLSSVPKFLTKGGVCTRSPLAVRLSAGRHGQPAAIAHTSWSVGAETLILCV